MQSWLSIKNKIIPSQKSKLIQIFNKIKNIKIFLCKESSHAMAQFIQIFNKIKKNYAKSHLMPWHNSCKQNRCVFGVPMRYAFMCFDEFFV